MKSLFHAYKFVMLAILVGPGLLSGQVAESSNNVTEKVIINGSELSSEQFATTMNRLPI